MQKEIEGEKNEGRRKEKEGRMGAEGRGGKGSDGRQRKKRHETGGKFKNRLEAEQLGFGKKKGWERRR